MNGYNLLIALVIVFSVDCEDVPIRLFRDESTEEILDKGRDRQIEHTVYKTVNKYYCSVANEFEGSHLVVFGTKEWNFPQQDVNLTLTYPTVEQTRLISKNVMSDRDSLVITEFKVVIYIDGPTSEGYITSGGLLKEFVKLTFVSSAVTTLKYEFWVYGVNTNRPAINFTSTFKPINLCTAK